jgi:hypothetical protein
LIVDADAPLSFAVARKSFPPILGRDTQVIETAGIVNHPELAPRHRLDLVRQLAGKLSLPDLPRFIVVVAITLGY